MAHGAELVERCRATGGSAAFLLFSCSAAVQTHFSRLIIPAVICGSAFPEAANLPVVTVDQTQVGWLLVDHLARRGRRKFALLQRPSWGCGDNEFIAGAHRAMAHHGLDADALSQEIVDVDPRAVASAVRRLHGERGHGSVGRTSETAVIVRGRQLAEWAHRVIRELSHRKRNRLELAMADSIGSSDARPPYPCVRMRCDHTDVGCKLGELVRLAQRASLPAGRKHTARGNSSQAPRPHHHILDVAIQGQ